MNNSQAIRAFSALAHETRLEIFRLLVKAGSSGMAAGAVAEALNVPAATLSFHLKELKAAGLLACRRESRSLIYSPDFDAMTRLLVFMTENCCGGAAAGVGAPVTVCCD